MKTKRRVSILSLAVLSGLVALVGFDPAQSTLWFKHAQNWISDSFGWFYVISVALFLVTLVYCAFGKPAKLKLGSSDSVAEFGFLPWCAMLFCTGMGIGLVFFGVAEPVLHYLSPPNMQGETSAAVGNAMTFTFFHWGLHAWAIYGVVALIIAFVAYRNNLPVEMRTALYPLLGYRITGWIGDTVDGLAVLATVIGIVAPLGFGVMQINSGLNHLFGIPQTTQVQLVLIAVIGVVTCLSLILGLDKGIKRLSVLNIGIAISLMLIVLFAGDTIKLIGATLNNIGSYAVQFVPLTFETHSSTNPAWFRDWTLLYWAWWIAFAAPTGIFIARISRGRTVREFVFGVLLVPVALSFLWFSIFGNSALELIHAQGLTELLTAVSDNPATALFKFFDLLLGWEWVAYLALSCIFIFFITTADSGTLVINLLTSSDGENVTVSGRIFWVGVELLITAILLMAGGMDAIRAVLIILGFPFAVIVVLMCAGFFKALYTSEVDVVRN